MAWTSRLKRHQKRPLTPKDVIENALQGYTKKTRRQMVNDIYGALKGKGMLNEQ